MRLAFVFAALIALSACGRNDAQQVQEEMARRQQSDAASAQQAGEADQHFIDQVKARPDAVTTPSGLIYVFTHHSSNPRLPKPPPSAQVLVNYEGKLTNGTIFDSSFQRGQPAAFPLDQVVPGFSEVIQLMRPGDELIAVFPPALGYGAAGQPPTIPPNSVLQFRIQLLAFQASPTSPVVQAPRGG